MGIITVRVRLSQINARMKTKHFFNQTPLYEDNYRRFMLLAPEMQFLSRNAHKSLCNRRRCHLVITEQSKFTTTVSLLVSLFDLADTYQKNPELSVRIYHDAKVAEVIGAQNQRHFLANNSYPNERMHLPDEKHQLNRFLGELLEHLTRLGVAPYMTPQQV